MRYLKIRPLNWIEGFDNVKRKTWTAAPVYDRQWYYIVERYTDSRFELYTITSVGDHKAVDTYFDLSVAKQCAQYTHDDHIITTYRLDEVQLSWFGKVWFWLTHTRY